MSTQAQTILQSAAEQAQAAGAPTSTNDQFSEQNLQYAQGMVLATLAQIAPSFAEWWAEQMKANVAMSIGTLNSAKAAGWGQAIAGGAEALAGAAGAVGGFYGVSQSVSAAKSQLTNFSKFYGPQGSITGVNNQIAANEEKLTSLGNGVSFKQQGFSVELEEEVPGKGKAPVKPVNASAEDSNLASSIKSDIRGLKAQRDKLQAAYDNENSQIKAKMDQGSNISNIASSVAQAVSRPIYGVAQQISTTRTAMQQLQSALASYASQQQSASIQAFDQLLQGINGLFGVNQALAARA